MLAIQVGLPNHVELPELSGRLHSLWHKVLGGPAALARRPTPANQKNTVRHTRTAGTTAANGNLIARPQAQQAAGLESLLLALTASFLVSFLLLSTAGINRSNTAVRAVLEQPCSTGGRTGTVRPKHLPPGRTGLSDQFLGPVAQDQPGPVGQICPTSWLLLRSDSARPTTG
ncbi:hypothetical protein PCANC_24798 [Puccinia coronata f. sp. avenae]|uniref:Uncharacterized protein n=1 Tax=Puccinia coronata f. sp. avenae TaxID=200324 RepID=A0A2N5TQI5_9BASI|nr:hypothetical protein PCANC_24798 [Puccinia coronata f. sp. avenae]